MNNIPIVYENDEILIINKPVGLSVQGGEGIVSSVDTVLPTQLGYKVFLVHRLDKETAGIMVYAKSSKSAASLSKQIEQNSIRKHYYAVVKGSPEEKSGVLKDLLFRDKQKDNDS